MDGGRFFLLLVLLLRMRVVYSVCDLDKKHFGPRGIGKNIYFNVLELFSAFLYYYQKYSAEGFVLKFFLLNQWNDTFFLLIQKILILFCDFFLLSKM